MSYKPKTLLNVRPASFTNDTVYHMGNQPEMAVSEEKPRLSDNRYKIAIDHISLLRVMEEIDNAEVKRLITLLHSPDHENWHVAEECIKQKLS